jgi:hypothetical protein
VNEPATPFGHDWLGVQKSTPIWCGLHFSVGGFAFGREAFFSAASSGKKKGHGANPKKHAEAPHLTKI